MSRKQFRQSITQVETILNTLDALKKLHSGKTFSADLYEDGEVYPLLITPTKISFTEFENYNYSYMVNGTHLICLRSYNGILSKVKINLCDLVCR